MSPKKVFLTGATGYIGGDVLFGLRHAEPDWRFKVLVRDEAKGAEIKANSPGVEIVMGSLDDFDVIKRAASQADIVIHTADSSDHPGAARAIAEGLASTHSPSNPAYYIHVSGTGILCWYDADNNRYGEAPLPEQAYDDLDGIDAVTSLPDQAWHRDVDKIVLAEAARDPKAVKIAIVCPPTIYGTGRGIISQRSRQVPLLIALTLEHGAAPVIGNGLTEWDNVHVRDLSDLIILLAKQSLRAEPDSNEEEIFGPKGYFFCENGTHRWAQLAEEVAREANKQGLINGTSTMRLDIGEAREKLGMEPVTWGLNSRGAAKRARKYLGWKPERTLQSYIPELVSWEGERRKDRGSSDKKTPVPASFKT